MSELRNSALCFVENAFYLETKLQLIFFHTPELLLQIVQLMPARNVTLTAEGGIKCQLSGLILIKIISVWCCSIYSNCS